MEKKLKKREKTIIDSFVECLPIIMIMALAVLLIWQLNKLPYIHY